MIRLIDRLNEITLKPSMYDFYKEFNYSLKQSMFILEIYNYIHTQNKVLNFNLFVKENINNIEFVCEKDKFLIKLDKDTHDITLEHFRNNEINTELVNDVFSNKQSFRNILLNTINICKTE